MNFSLASIIASIIFSGVGLIALRHARSTTNFTLAFLGVALMVYSLLTPTLFATWTVGLGLTVAAWYLK